MDEAGAPPEAVEEDEIPAVSAAMRGDRGAFARLYARYAPMVHGLLISRVPFQDVDDLLQDLFASALARLHQLREAGAFGAWLAAIARNKAADHRRGAREALELPEDLPAPSIGAARKSPRPWTRSVRCRRRIGRPWSCVSSRG